MSQLGSNRRKGSSLGTPKRNRGAGSRGMGLREEAARPGQGSHSPPGLQVCRWGRRGVRVCQASVGDVCSFQGVSHSQSEKPVWNWREYPGWRENGLQGCCSQAICSRRKELGQPALERWRSTPNCLPGRSHRPEDSR